MPIAITIPRLGWNMDEGVFVGWLKKDGDEVRAGDALFTVEGEKAAQDIECLDSGTLRIAPDAPQPGDVVPVGTVIGLLVPAGEAEPVAPQAGPAARRLARQRGVDLRQVAGTGPGGRVITADVERSAVRAKPRSSPRARRVAAELGIDWTKLRGSGRTGRIREKDVRAGREVLPERAERTAAPGQAIPITPIRRTIAERLTTSLRSTAPVTLTCTIDATNLVSLRNQFQAVAVGVAERVPSYTDFFVKLTATALQRHALLNARWDGEQIIVAEGVHIGIAVDAEAGLLVPVIRDVPRLGLREVAARARDLIERARQRRLRAEEMQGGTFTVTNLGAFGVEAFTPIINYPQCAVLGVGCIRREPVATTDDRVVVRERLTLSLTFDHRMVDGAPAARFLQELGGLIENPGPALVG
jgi:pyruvate dehydrogenase E2 component (dihydrolipoamide acetyltransferase)